MMMNHAQSVPDDAAERLAQYTMVGTADSEESLPGPVMVRRDVTS